MLLYRLSKSENDVPSAVQEYLDSKCTCEASLSTTSSGDVKISHHIEGHRSTLRNLPPNILSKVDALTQIDVQVYKLALLEFLADIVWLESDEELGCRVLYQPVLEEHEAMLSYLDISVTQEYTLLKDLPIMHISSKASH